MPRCGAQLLRSPTLLRLWRQLARDAEGTVHATPTSSTTLDVVVDRLTGKALTDRLALAAEKQAALGAEASTQRLPAVRATPLPSSTGHHEDTTADHVILVLPVPEGSTADDLMFTTSGNSLFTEITDPTRLFSVRVAACVYAVALLRRRRVNEIVLRSR